MFNQNFSPNGDLFIIKDKALRLKIKRQLQLNQIIKESIQQNTYNILNQRNQSEYLKELIKPNSLYDNLVDESNMHVVNKMPFLLFGLVKTIFLEDKTGQQQTIYGCGILIDSNVILLSAQNLIYDDNETSPEEEEEEEEDEDKGEENKKNEKEKKEKNNYNFFSIEFQPLNLSPEYRSYFPRSIKVIDHYTPMNQNENIYKPDSNIKEDEGKSDFNKIEEKTVKNDMDKVGNRWGIGYLEYPVGDIINYIYKKTKVNPTKMNKYMIKRNKNKINFDDESIFDKLKIDNLTEEELAKTDFIFLECLTRVTEDQSEEEDEGTANNNENQEQNNNENNNNENQINKENEESKNIKDNTNNNENKKENKDKNEINSDKKDNNNINEENNENKKEEENNNEENGETEESSALTEQPNVVLPYQYFESQYLMEFDQKFIYLKNIYQIEELDKNILPGFIIGKYMNKYHILGMNTSNIIEIKSNGEENKENVENNKSEENKNNEENNNNEEQKEKEDEKNNEKQNNENISDKKDESGENNNNIDNSLNVTKDEINNKNKKDKEIIENYEINNDESHINKNGNEIQNISEKNEEKENENKKENENQKINDENEVKQENINKVPSPRRNRNNINCKCIIY